MHPLSPTIHAARHAMSACLNAGFRTAIGSAGRGGARRQTWSRAALCMAMATAPAPYAHAFDMNTPPSQEGYAPPMDSGAVAAPRTGTRGLFVATIAALVAQGLGNGLGTALSQGLGGSITRWFGSKAAASDEAEGAASPMSAGAVGAMGSPRLRAPSEAHAQAPAAQARMQGEPEPSPLQAGLAYEVHLLGGGQAAGRAVDPARHAFRTGERFQVHYRPSLPGRVKVFNIDPAGREQYIDSVEVAAGQLASLGPYRFVGSTGAETLRLVLEPCSTAALTVATRAIVNAGAKASPAAARPSLQPTAMSMAQLHDCRELRTNGLPTRTRSIRKTTLDGMTAFALDPLSNEERRTGRVEARELQISLQHRRALPATPTTTR